MIMAGNLPPQRSPPQKQGLIEVLLTTGWLAIRRVGFQIDFWAPPKVGIQMKKNEEDFFRLETSTYTLED